MKRRDHTGERYGRLVILGDAPSKGVRRVICQCDCGATTETNLHAVRQGATKSCGCLGRENRSKATRKHRMTGSPEYVAWNAMKQRVKAKRYRAYYRDRGITVCARWAASFESFYKDMGPKPGPDYSLDRIDNDGNYEPQNCRWATRLQQNRNLSTTRRVKFGGTEVPLNDLADKWGLKITTLRGRLEKGMSLKEALTTPVKHRKTKGTT